MRPYFINEDQFVHDSLGYHGQELLDTAFYSSKKIKSIGFYAVDKFGLKSHYKVGFWTEYYENGQIESLGLYALQSVYGCCSGNACILYYSYKFGNWTYYYDNGQLKAKGVYELKKKEINTGVAGQYSYSAIVTESWRLNDSDGQPTKDKDKIILELTRSAF